MTIKTNGIALLFDKTALSFDSTYELFIKRLVVPAGQITALLGPSGCGKSTLLNLAAGYLKAQSGVVYHDGVPLDGPALDTALLFQQRNLFPWMSALENISFALENQGWSAQKAKYQAMQYLSQVGLEAYAHHYPAALSGGMQQRVGLARALAMQARLFLMDEPFSALDSYTRQQMYAHILKAWERLSATFLIITHDVQDALALAHQIVVMRRYPKPEIAQVIHLDQKRLAKPNRLSVHQQQSLIEIIYQEMKAS